MDIQQTNLESFMVPFDSWVVMRWMLLAGNTLALLGKIAGPRIRAAVPFAIERCV
jgi:hypothetical protein